MQRQAVQYECVLSCGLQDAEVDMLGRVAAALNVPPTVVELKIFEWQVRRGCTIWSTGPVDVQSCWTVEHKG